MATRKAKVESRSVRNGNGRKGVVRGKKARCVAVADNGVKTGAQFAQLMSLLIGDIASDRIDAKTANAMCNAGGKLLKVVEMQHKYGGNNAAKVKTLSLTT
jgi:hypothetical protein